MKPAPRPSRRALVPLLAAGLAVAGPPGFGAETRGGGGASEARPIPGGAELLGTLRREHPRLLATATDFAALRQRLTTNAVLQRWREQLREQAERMMREAPAHYEIPDGLRLLSVSRRVLHRVQTLALLDRLEGGARYAERAGRELDAAAAFADWNPRHFLDTAEMTHAFAIGYDWLYDRWTPDQRERYRSALVEKGLKLGLACYQGTASYGGWTRARHNWNQVCNGGIGLGALAVADEEPALAGEFLHEALRSLQLPMREFAPDGAWAEGPGYWNYATTYNVAILAALQTALGHDFGLSGIPGFGECGTFPVQMTGPFGRTFNYADGGDGAIRAPHLFWLAREFDRPEYAAYEEPLAAPHPLDLLWYRGAPSGPAPPPGKYFHGAEVVALRSAWHDPRAVFVGFKAGDNKANHSHLDLGNFVLDALGVRWAIDLGADDYNLPAYFGKQRWTYYRLRAEGHNTLVLNPGAGPDQPPAAAARVTRFESSPTRAFAVADLTAAYAGAAQRVQRGVALLEGRRVLVQDELRANPPAELWWFLHTKAAIGVAADGASATLSAAEARLRATILSPAGAVFTVRDAVPLPSSPQPEKQNRNEGVRKLAIHLPGVSECRLVVLLEPVDPRAPPSAPPPQVEPLASWR